ncbi:transposable element p transposase [Plakobranchus ocellatus]|uniref:Transposable element p transposase n=1 Tax=Plakobranchus ocellatus TaxID=259542 RepID=A0AAV4CP41_9GAST|nr:transposable element p transposase [Plakobranchus ocellatus]
MTSHEHLCAIVIDEMALKRSLQYDPINDEVEGLEDYGRLGRTKLSAHNALVIMVRGTVGKWKQPLAYFLSKGPTKASLLQTIVEDAVKEVLLLGLVPKVIIWDQGSNNRAVVQKLGVTCDKPYATFGVTKVFMMFDPPHLMKSIRNNLKRHGFTKDGADVSW